MSGSHSITQYRAAHDSAVLFDLTGWTVLELSGRDGVPFLNNFCTNDLKTLAPGEGCEAFVTNVKARVLGHVLVFTSPDEPSRLTLITAPGQAVPLAAHLDRYVIREDVTIRDRTEESAVLYAVGLTADDEAAPAAGRFTSRAVTVGGVAGTVRRADLFQTQGSFVEVPREAMAATIERFASMGFGRAEPAAFESLRVESAFPLYGIDITEDQLAPEVDRPWAISYTKGCYLGQEPIARIDALGHVNRLLRGLKLDPGPLPMVGATILADGKEIGVVTSAAMGCNGDAPVALGYVRAKFANPGVIVTVQTGEGEVSATVFRAAR